MHDPAYKALAERLEALREKHEQGLLVSVEFLKQLLDLAKDVVATEQVTPPVEQEDRGKAALTELFESIKTGETPIVVEQVVADIDVIVRHVRHHVRLTRIHHRDFQEADFGIDFQQ